MKRGYIERNPTFGLAPHGTRKRARVLSDNELKAVLRACDDLENDLPYDYRKIVKLLIICGQRRGEIAALRTSFIEGSLVTLPASLTKNGRIHCFWLSELAADVLRGAEIEDGRNDALFFPARGKPDKRTMDGQRR
jgi:integrase